MEAAEIEHGNKRQPRLSIWLLALLLVLVRAMFFHRRKYMRSVAVAAFKGQLSKPQVDEVLAAASLKEDSRTEQLAVAELQTLAELFRQKLIEVTGDENPRLANQGN